VATIPTTLSVIVNPRSSESETHYLESHGEYHEAANYCANELLKAAKLNPAEERDVFVRNR
jgi:hypothetical protein